MFLQFHYSVPVPVKGKICVARNNGLFLLQADREFTFIKHLPSKRASALIVLIVLGKLTLEKGSPVAAFLRVPA